MKPAELAADFLLLDAATPLVQTGLWREGEWVHWVASREEAGRSLFAGVERIFQAKSISINEIGGFLFCVGPGSMLGIRIASMAIRGWQSLLPQPLPIFCYGSHDLMARSLLARGRPAPFHLISDARRDRWNVTSVEEPGIILPLRQLPREELALLTGPFLRMEERVRGEAPVSVGEMCPYDLQEEAARFLEPDFLHRSMVPEPWGWEVPEFKKWSAERHR